MANRNRNKFCSLDDLTNEASVEQFFVSRLLVDLGYRDSQIKPKMSLQTLVVNLGRRKLNYKPDYAIEVESQIRWIIDAKSTTEGLDDYVGQCAGYCLNLNRGYNDENPVLYFMLTNGILTQIYEWDREEPILELNFSDFDDNNENYKRLRDLLQMSVFTGNRSVNVTSSGDGHTLYRKSISDVNSDFAWCHQFIYKKDNLSQSAAFMEFIKIVFLKLLSDRDIHRKYPSFSSQTEITLPTQEVKFSERWIEERESDHPNPLDALQFHTLLQSLESEIQTGERKRIFDANEHINLTPETIKGVVRRLENTDLFGIDADLNGRLFETFLNATMRGKDLGQFFTPRSVVKLTVRLANIRVSREHVDTVIDACCGTGGFLIDAFGDMLHKIETNKSLTDQERKDLQRLIATQRVYGIDIAVDPPLARIARINMYLHGDGGSSIYQADILDKAIEDIPTDSPEKKREKAELRDMLASGGFADVVLTNPPFAKEYKREFVRDDRILDEYVLAFEKAGGKRKPRSSLKSSLMFLERYYDMLKPAGRMLTVIDDSVLGGTKYRWVRDYIREKFIIRGVISLPGDAFQRSKARVKTSILYLQKKRHPDEEQPPIFMYYCTTVGIDDPARQRVLPIDEQNRIIANREIEEAGAAFEAFLAGDPSVNKWIVSPDAIQDRMDVKSVLLTPGRNVGSWTEGDVQTIQLSQLVDLIHPGTDDDHDDVIITNDADELVTHLRVQYDGFAEAGEEIFASDSNYTRLYRVHQNDLVISNINAVHGAVAIVPPELDGSVVTTEYTVCRAKHGMDPRLVWMLLRTPEIRADLLLLATGIGRNRVRWDNIAELQLPLPNSDLIEKLVETIQRAEELERKAEELREETYNSIENMYNLNSTEAQAILAAFKPPR